MKDEKACWFHELFYIVVIQKVKVMVYSWLILKEGEFKINTFMQPTVTWDTLSAHAWKTSTLCVCEEVEEWEAAVGWIVPVSILQHLFMTIIAFMGFSNSQLDQLKFNLLSELQN